LTQELVIDGLMRDFLRQMQVLRKDVGLEIEDRIAVIYKTDSEKVKAAIETYKDFLCSELLCVQITEDVNHTSEKRFRISGEEVFVEIKKMQDTD
jgi:isoleucyl-tRNA synthetase